MNFQVKITQFQYDFHIVLNDNNGPSQEYMYVECFYNQDQNEIQMLLSAQRSRSLKFIWPAYSYV